MATVELRKCCWRYETTKGTEAKQMGARLSAGGRWRDEGVLGRVVAWLGRVEATRGRFSSTRRPRPDGGRPLNQPIHFVSRER